jgi:hypothetical protein
MMPDAPAPDADDTDAGSGVTAAFESAIMSIVKEALAKGQDKKSVLKTIGKLLDGHADVNGGTSSTDDDATADATAKEGAAAAAAAAAAAKPAAEATILDEIVREGFTPSATQLAALRGMADPATRTAFIREQKGLQAASRPKSASREGVAATVREGAAGGADQPTPVEEARQLFAAESARLRGVPSKN